MFRKLLLCLFIASTAISLPSLAATDKPDIAQLEKQAAKNDTKAMLELAKYYFVHGESSSASFYIMRAVELGDPEAIAIKKKLQKAIRQISPEEIKNLQQKAANNDPNALDALGNAYFDGFPGLPQDTKKGLQLLEKAVKAGSIFAESRLGFIYFTGQHGIKRDFFKGINLMESAAKKGDPIAKKFLQDGQAFLTIGIYTLEGMQGFKKDPQKALQYLQKAASKNNADAELMLAIIYRTGEKGIAQNLKEGEKWLKKSASHGNEKAKELLLKIEKAKK